MECLGPEYEAPTPRLTSSIAPAYFGYEVVTHKFPQPFIVRGVEKYSGDMKPNLWLNDYLTFVELAQGDQGNTLCHVTSCLSGLTRSWLDGIPPNSIHNWVDFEHEFLNSFEGTYQRPGSLVDLYNIMQGTQEPLCDFIARWLRKKNMIPNISDGTTIEAFVNGALDPMLRHKIGRKRVQGQLPDLASFMMMAN